MAKSKKIQGGGSYRLLGKDKDKRNIYEVTVATGFNPVTKKYESRTRRVHGTIADVVKTRDALTNEAMGGVIKGADKATFYEFSSVWLERRKADGEIATMTARTDRYILGVLWEYIGGCRLKDITPLLVDKLYSQIRNERGVSNSTLHKYHVILNEVMKRAVNLGYVISNPLDRVKAPTPEKGERSSLGFEDAAQLHRCISKETRKALAEFEAKEQRREDWGKADKPRQYVREVRPVSCSICACIGLATGARRGEILALTWADIDLTRESVRISHSLNARMEVKQPKTRAGIRTIAIDAGTASTLKSWKAIQRGMLARIGKLQTSSTPVCSNSLGEYIDPNAFSSWWRKFAAANGFAGLKFHELRHTQATLLLAKGTDVKTVQARLGHSSASITLDMYAHAMLENDRESAGTIAAIFAQPAPPRNVVKFA